MNITRKTIKEIFDNYFKKAIAPSSQEEVRTKSDFTQQSITEMWRWMQCYPEELSVESLNEMIINIIMKAELYANELWQKSITKFEIALACEEVLKDVKLLNLF